MLNDTVISTRPQHWVGLGVVADTSDTIEKGIANLLCKVYDNVPKGQLRVYVNRNKRWEGPFLVLAEHVTITG